MSAVNHRQERYRSAITLSAASCVIIASMLCASCARYRPLVPAGRVATGAEVLFAKHIDSIRKQKVGLVANRSARVGNMHLLDALLSEGVKVTAILAPEHGFRGDLGAGEVVADGIDAKTGIPIHSLYGEHRRPTAEMLGNVDLLIFDIQDVGARFYTYIATLGGVLAAAGDAGIPVWILDRPNPAGGDYVGGWMRADEFESFLAPYPIPVAHGLTMGEMARMIVGEEWVRFSSKPRLVVVPMRGWQRGMKWPDTGLEWIPPSPNLPTFEHAFMYLGTALFEGTSLSEGRGTDDPFLLVGSPATRLSPSDLEDLQAISESIRITPAIFTPRAIPGAAPHPKHEGIPVKGIRIGLRDYGFDPITAGLELLAAIVKATPDCQLNEHLYRLAGSREIDKVIDGSRDAGKLRFGLESYLKQRQKYLLY